MSTLIWTAITSKPAAIISEFLVVMVTSAFLVIGYLYEADQKQLTVDAHTIAQLQGAIKNQDTQIKSWQAQSDKAKKTAQGVLQAARKAGLASEAKATAILNRPAPAPENACAAADSLILGVTQ